MREKAYELMNAIYKEEQKEKIAKTRNAFTDVVAYILENMEDSREKSLVLTKLYKMLNKHFLKVLHQKNQKD